MKICCISDTHNCHEELNKYFTKASIQQNKIDVVIHAGDFTDNGTYEETRDFLTWFVSLRVKHKILIAGNHEIVLDTSRYDEKPNFYHPLASQRVNSGKILDLVMEGHEKGEYCYLNNDSISVQGINFFGSPYSPHARREGVQQPPWGFQHHESILKHIWGIIPDDTDVIITHTPPYGTLDDYRNIHQGSISLAERVREISPQLHVFGHVHGKHGFVESDNIIYINASVVDGQKKKNNEPVIIEIFPREEFKN